MIARNDALTDLEKIIDILHRHEDSEGAAPVLHDISEVQRLLEYYSFRTPQLADRFAARLQERYRFEFFGLYGASDSARRRPESSYLYLQQLLGQLVRVAVARLCCEGVFSLSPTQIADSDGMLLLRLTQ